MTVEIVEIIGRAEQGVTKPFICRGEDNQIYFVKGQGAGMRSLICEWIAGQLGLLLGLPIAPFAFVEVPQELLAIAMRDDLAELGSGKAFGSRKVSVVELSASHVEHVPAATQRDVLAFDWWVRNGDRSLGETGAILICSGTWRASGWWSSTTTRLSIRPSRPKTSPICMPFAANGTHCLAIGSCGSATSIGS